ncbi:MAG TPA: hypothetical protein VMG12_30095 [Polyangiaceae bacterium]|nr:hypothetical protein [Polyangiaceae bacterium]
MLRSSFPSLLVLVSSASTLAACSSPEPRAFDVGVEVTTAEGREPVPGAAVRARGEPAVMTDALGRSLLHLRGQAGDRVPITLGCPGASGAPGSDAELILPGVSAASADEAPALRLTCAAASRDAVVLVHAAGGASSLPVKVDGVVVGQTDALGFAHVHVRTSSRAQFEVSLDTSSNPGLSPANPAQRFELDRTDELFVFDTTFDSAASARKGKRSAKKPRRALDTID